MKILLGGVPFGCDNVGDEAILASVVHIFRRNFPAAALTVATRDRAATAAALNVATVPLFGFDAAFPVTEFGRVIADYDWYVWAGATGLSDYPAMGCALLRAAQERGVGTVLWQVGMNDEFNPAFFRLAGRRRWFARCFGGVAFHEARRVRAIRRELAATLGKCAFIAVRDPESLTELRRCAPFPNAVSGADSAMLLEAAPPPGGFLAADGRKNLGLCISAQRALQRSAELAAFVDAMTADGRVRVVFIPMNPRTDYELMKNLQARLAHPENTWLCRESEPGIVAGVAGQCDLIVSSRLHLMILGLNALVPAIGIERGSKITNYLSPYGLTTAGSTENCDFGKLHDLATAILSADPDVFRRRAAQVRAEKLAALAAAEAQLRACLTGGGAAAQTSL